MARQNSEGQWSARCPAHEDRSPSLSIADGERGTVLHCHAGCSPSDVIAALGLRWSDLGSASPDPETRVHEEDVYGYHDESGFLLYEVVRMQGPKKDFRHRAADWQMTGRWSVSGVRRVPYRLVDLLEAKEVWVVEGEKDAETLIGHGLVATCNSGGAGKWQENFGSYFSGKTVWVVPDNDTPGLAHAVEVMKSIEPHAASVRIIHLPDAAAGEDVSDWLGGRDIGDLLRLRDSPPVQPAGASAFVPVDPDPRFRPMRQWLMGVSHLRGVISLLVARGGTGKSSLLVAEALALATGRGEEIVGEHVRRPCRVASIVLEDDWDEYHRRLEAAMIRFNIDAAHLGNRLLVTTKHRARFGSGDGGDSPEIEAWLAHEMITREIDVLQIDPWVNALAGSENDNVEIARITESLSDLARTTKTCIRIAHHVRKTGADATGDDARGASALLNAARVVHVLNSGHEDAVRAGEREEFARRVVRLDHDKANMSDRRRARYFRMDSVWLQNDVEGDTQGDQAAVIVPYSMPDVLAELTHPQIDDCVNAARQGLVESDRAKAWAGRTFGPILGIDVGEPSGKNRMKKIIAKFIDRGILKFETHDVKGRATPYLFPGPNSGRGPQGDDT